MKKLIAQKGVSKLPSPKPPKPETPPPKPPKPEIPPKPPERPNE